MRMFDPAIFKKGVLPNGWPVCPNCGQDELVPEGSACNLICENCDWKEVMATMQTDHERQIEALKKDLYRVEAEKLKLEEKLKLADSECDAVEADLVAHKAASNVLDDHNADMYWREYEHSKAAGGGK